MKAIIIQDCDAKALLDKLELVKLRERISKGQADVDNDELGRMHKVFHYEVCKWLQEHGAHLT